MQIGKISLHTTKLNKPTTANNNAATRQLSTNPFGVSFKGNVIQADVFETSNKSAQGNGIVERKIFRCKNAGRTIGKSQIGN